MAKERVALVIGNSAYAAAPFLPNAAQDAKDVSRTLGELGFRVFEGIDLSRSEMLRLAESVTAVLTAQDIALFYFSGHGMQIGSENFIMPIDAIGGDELQLKATSVNLQSILRQMELRSDRNIIILDACRNNPFSSQLIGRSIGGASRGLLRVDAGVGSYIAFSTQPGNVALDGTGRNSPFTTALLKHLSVREDDLHELMRKVRADVVGTTNSTQIPWENSSLIERIYLAQPGGRSEQTLASVSVSPVAPAQPNPIVSASSPAMTHMVSGLDPNGDGFLALRGGTTSNSPRLAKMVEGTRLKFLGQDGVWFHVLSETGQQGWAHSNWIRFTGTVQVRETNQCDALWMQRNGIFAKNGYCFKGARGKAAFANEICVPGLAAGDVPMSPTERNTVAEIQALESSLGCR